MQEESLHFVVTNGPDFDMDLLEEAYIGEEQVADIRRVENSWKVTFFPNDKISDTSVCELPWEVLVEIHAAFSKFKMEMDAQSEETQTLQATE
jgi:hypothetical protein